MQDIYVGLGFILLGALVYWVSPKSPFNIGYKSLQLIRSKELWSWSNRFFGRLFLIGSICYVLGLIILKIADIEYKHMNNCLFGILIIYFTTSWVITEIIIYIKLKNKK